MNTDHDSSNDWADWPLCPKCGHRLAWFENVPVVSWLVLRGRCRKCKAPISAQYPIVEAITAAGFVAVAWADGVDRVWYEALVAVRGDVTTAEFVFVCSRYLIHMVLLCTVWTAGLMQLDRNIPPRVMPIGSAVCLWLTSLALIHFSQRGDMTAYQPITITIDATPFEPIDMLVSGLLTAAFAMLSTYFWTWRAEEIARNRWTFAEFAFVAAMVIEPASMVLVIATAVALGLLAALVSRRANTPLLCLSAAVAIDLTVYQSIVPGQVGTVWWTIVSRSTDIWNEYYPIAFCTLIVLLTEACVLIRRRTSVLESAAAEEKAPDAHDMANDHTSP